MNKKKLIFLGLDVLVLVITIGVSLAVFNYVGKGNSSNVITSGYIRMNYTGNSNTINLPIAVPTSDEDGRNFGLEGSTCQNDNENNIQCYFDFIVSTNMNIDYNVGHEVTLEKDEESTLTNDGVRVYLEKQDSAGNYQELFTPKAFEEIDSENPNETDELGASNKEMLLDNGTINSSTTYYYRLRIWLAKDYKGLNESVTFSAKVNVYGSNAEVNSANGINLTDNGTEINGKTITMQKGNTKTISAEVLPDNTKNKNLIWESSDTNKVKVDSAGNITAVEIGTSVITISTSDKSKSATFTINVVNYDAKGVELNTKEVTLSKGNTYQLTSIVTPTDASDTSVTYKSSSEGIATITKDGLITAVGTGEATIIVETINGYTDTCKVIVTEPNVTNISINGDDNVDVGSTIQLTTTITSDSLESSNVVWTSSDESKAAVSSTGKVTGIEPGNVTITAYIKEYPDIKAIKTIEVKYPEIESITMSSDMTIYTENSTTFVIWTNPSEVSNLNAIRWKSSNTDVAIITENCSGSLSCTIKGISKGTSTIKAVVVDDKEEETTIFDTAKLTVYYVPSTEFKIGDYVYMEPTLSTWTGKGGTINPKELKLWRVFRFNGDKTIEIISEYVSSTSISLSGQSDWQNLTSILNNVAIQYKNDNFTSGAKIFGYNGQPDSCTNTESCKLFGVNSSTYNDGLYQNDITLANELGILNGTKLNDSVKQCYWTPSRYIHISSGYTFYGSQLTGGCNGLAYGTAYNGLYTNFSNYWSDTGGTHAVSESVRPILTLKSNLVAYGDGSESNPWVLVAN